MARALRKATRTIPIAVLADDLLLSGAVASLARPSGNITGVSIFAPEVRAGAASGSGHKRVSGPMAE